MTGSSSGGPHIASLLGSALNDLRLDTEAAAARFPGLRTSHLRLLNLIPDDGGRITDIAVNAAMSKQALGQFMRYLQDHGYLEITVDPTDRRARVVTKTAAGRRAERAALAAIAGVERRWEERLGPRRYAALRKALADVSVSGT